MSGLKRGAWSIIRGSFTWQQEGKGFKKEWSEKRGSLSSGIHLHGNRKEKVSEKSSLKRGVVFTRVSCVPCADDSFLLREENHVERKTMKEDWATVLGRSRLAIRIKSFVKAGGWWHSRGSEEMKWNGTGICHETHWAQQLWVLPLAHTASKEHYFCAHLTIDAKTDETVSHFVLLVTPTKAQN